MLFISESVILTDVSWDHLNAQGLIFGKEVEIDGSKYTVRSLTSYEYDKYIVPRKDEFYYNSFTWCQEVHSFNLARRVIRGNFSASYFSYRTSSFTSSSLGWRPVIEGDKDPNITVYELLSKCGIGGGSAVGLELIPTSLAPTEEPVKEDWREQYYRWKSQQ